MTHLGPKSDFTETQQGLPDRTMRKSHYLRVDLDLAVLCLGNVRQIGMYWENRAVYDGFIHFGVLKSSVFQSPRITDFRYYLSSAGCGYLSMCMCGYRCPFDCSHTIQPTALKLWHTIPHLTN